MDMSTTLKTEEKSKRGKSHVRSCVQVSSFLRCLAAEARMTISLPDNLSSSSSVDSTSHFPLPSSSSDECCGGNNGTHDEYGSRPSDLSTDLRLGLTFPSSDPDIASTSSQREKRPDWPPIKPLLRNTLTGKAYERGRYSDTSLFVKVYMEGIPIGRKLDLYAFDGYEGLLAALSQMFKTPILCPEDDDGVHSGKHHHVLTYEDKEEDWMMVGDIPWEMFLGTVRRLKITRQGIC